MKRVSKSELKPKLLEYLREVESTGEPLIITDHGRPVARIEAHSEGDDTLERLRGVVLRYEGPTLPVAEQDWEQLQ